MTYSSSLDDKFTPLVLDTSVLINLHASTFGLQILSSLPNDILIPDVVTRELGHDVSRLSGEHRFVQNLVARSEGCLATMDDHEYELFEMLTSGSSSLGDGEAATVAIAVRRRLLPVIDEKRGRARAQDLMPGKVPCWSLDLFRHALVVATLGEADAIDALYLALRDGRMRIHPDHCDQVVMLIGVQRALSCVSLPNFKSRRAAWAEAASRLGHLPASGATRPDGNPE